MAIVEDVTDHDGRFDDGPDTKLDLLPTLRRLSKRLALPENLLPSFMSEEKRAYRFLTDL